MDSRAAMELLFAWLSPDGRERIVSQVSQLPAADWEMFLGLANLHRVAPLLYQRLKAAGVVSALPPGVMQALRDAYMDSAGASMPLYHELGKVLGALREKGIPVIVLKGGDLALGIYENTALRPMTDLDLLVPTPRFADAEAMLRLLGYAPRQPFYIEAVQQVSPHAPAFVKPGVVPIEVHWDLVEPFSPIRIDLEGLWQRARPTNIAGVDVLALSLEDQVVYLCVHISFHHWFEVGLLSWCDIAQLLHSCGERVDWEQVLRLACRWGGQRGVYLTLWLSKELLGTRVPDDMLHALVPSQPGPQFLHGAREQVLGVPAGSQQMSSNLARAWHTPGLRERMLVVLKVIFPSTQFLSLVYSVPLRSWRIWLCYLRRWRDLAWQYGPSVWRLLWHDRQTAELAEQLEGFRTLRSWLDKDVP